MREPDADPTDPAMAETALRVTVEPYPSGDDVQVVLEGLQAFNAAKIGPTERVPLGVFVRGSGGEVLGGLVGMMRYGWLHVDWLWLGDDVRGQGLGTAVMAAAETEARRRGCIGAHLETTAYQALPFYEGLGYTVFGVLEGNPVGSKSYFLRKEL